MSASDEICFELRYFSIPIVSAGAKMIEAYSRKSATELMIALIKPVMVSMGVSLLYSMGVLLFMKRCCAAIKYSGKVDWLLG